MAKYVFPAVFEEEGGAYSVYFPDIEGCFTCGDSLAQAMEMAQDALALMLYDYEADGRMIPEPSAPGTIQAGSGFVSYVCADTLEYQKRFNKKAVKKTLTIPEWMNEAATRAGVNFSQVLQEALTSRLGLE